MINFEKELKEVLEKNGDFDVVKSETLRKGIVQMFEDKLKKVKLWTWAFLLIDVVIIAVGVSSLLVNLLITKNTNAVIVSAIVVLVAHEGTVLIKLWYWILNSKYEVLKELKQLQLQIAEQSGKNAPSGN
jgi:ABC-type sugar transport system permease subunit